MTRKKSGSMIIAGVTYYSLSTVAGMMRKAVVTVQGWMLTGKMTGTKIGGMWYVTEDNLNDFIQNGGGSNVLSANNKKGRIR